MNISEYNKSVDLYSDGAYRFILNNIKNKFKAQDIVQDTFEKLWLNVDKVDFIKVKSYIFTTAYHTLIDLVRREKKFTEFDNNENINISVHNEYSDLKEILNKAIDKLPLAQKSVIMLRDYEGYTYEEISEITGLNESQVKVYIYRARVFLKEYIGNLNVLV